MLHPSHTVARSATALVLSLGLPGGLLAQQTFHTLFGDPWEDGFGWAADSAGDQDGDGYDDVFVSRSGVFTARASVFSGFDGRRIRHFWGDPQSGYGVAVARLGDTNGDGRDELVVGSPFVDTGAAYDGAVFFYSGTGAFLFTVESIGIPGHLNPRFGTDLARAGDLNGDGAPDLLVGAPWEPPTTGGFGYVAVLSGVDGAVLGVVDGPSAADRFGGAVAGPGDVDGDGRPDLLVGAADDGTAGTAAGRAYVFSGRTGAPLLTLDGPQPGFHFGKAVSGAGDADRDGHADLFVGADDAARVYSGRTGVLLASFSGVGEAVALIGDVNGDGRPEFAASRTAGGAAGGGLVNVYDGRTGALLDTFEGEAAGDRFGTALAGAGDVNGDGRADLVAGAPGVDGQVSDSGMALVISGVPFTLAAGNLVAGQTAGFRASHVRPLHGSWLYYSLTGPGSTFLAHLNVSLEIDSPVLAAGPTQSNATGEVAWALPVPAGAQGRRVWIQVAQSELITNVIAATVR